MASVGVVEVSAEAREQEFYDLDHKIEKLLNDSAYRVSNHECNFRVTYKH